MIDTVCNICENDYDCGTEPFIHLCAVHGQDFDYWHIDLYETSPRQLDEHTLANRIKEFLQEKKKELLG